MGLPMKRLLLKSIAKANDKKKGATNDRSDRSTNDRRSVKKPSSSSRSSSTDGKSQISKGTKLNKFNKYKNKEDPKVSKYKDGNKEKSSDGIKDGKDKKKNFGRRDWKQEKKEAEETEFETVQQGQDVDDQMGDADDSMIRDSESDDDDLDMDGDSEAKMIDDSLKAANRKGKKSGGFQSMGRGFLIGGIIRHFFNVI
jgi:hypothetical protein